MITCGHHYRKCDCGTSVHRNCFCKCGRNPWNIEPELYARAKALREQPIEEFMEFLKKVLSIAESMPKVLKKVNSGLEIDQSLELDKEKAKK